MNKYELKAYRDSVIEQRQLRRRIEDLETRIYYLKSPALTGMPHAQNTVSGSSQEKAAAQCIEQLDALRAEYIAKEAAITAGAQTVETAIDALPYRYRTLLRAYYVEGLRWQKVADMYPCSFDTAMRMHRRALEMLKKVNANG